jgi:hypothetical protein
MAVKVMVAHAIVNGAIAKEAPARKGESGASAKRKRRRSSVFDAEGNEVFLTLLCLKCQKMRPLSQFGLRRMADGAIRNQPWCRTCRSASAAERPRRRASAGAMDAPVAEAPAAERSAGEQAAPPTTPSPSVAAEVAAALAAGLRR